MKALKIIGMVIGGLIALFLVVAAVLPSSYSVERTIEINEPAEVVYALVANLPNGIRRAATVDCVGQLALRANCQRHESDVDN
jgi:hypothetical protein